METKTHWKKLNNPNYIGAYSIMGSGKDLVVTIERVVKEQVTGSDGKKEECTIAYLKGQKPMILNSTNCKMIAKIHNTPFIEEWSGKQITLYVAQIKAFGEHVDALRIRPKKPSTKLPELTPQHENWAKIKQSINSGAYKISQYKTKYTISDTNAKLLELNEAV